MTERKKALYLLAELYGPMKKGERVESEKHSSRKIANELGYDEGQLSRILNPGHGKEKSDETYRRLAQRLKMNKEAKRGKLFRALSIIFGIISLVLASQYFLGPNSTQVEVSSQNRLTASETSEMITLYNNYIQSQLINQGLVFNSQVKEGIYVPGEFDSHFENLAIEINNSLSNTRKLLAKIHLHTQNGIELSAMFENFNENNINSNLEGLIEVLVNKDISTSNLANIIASRVGYIQTRNAARFDSIAALPIEEVVFPDQ